MDGEHQRGAVELGGRHPDGKDRENLVVWTCTRSSAQPRPRSQDRGQDGCLQAVGLAEAPYGKPQTHHAGVVAEASEAQRGGRARGNNLLDDAPPIERSGELNGMLLHPPLGSKLASFPTWSRRAVRTPSRALTPSLESHLLISERH